MSKNDESVKFIAVGDVSPRQDAVFDSTRSILRGADITGQDIKSLKERGAIL